MLHAKRIGAITIIILSLAEFSRVGLSQGSDGSSSAVSVAVASQYDTTHVYVSPSNVDAFVRSFLGTFGGTTTKQVSVTVTPTPSTTTSATRATMPVVHFRSGLAGPAGSPAEPSFQ